MTGKTFLAVALGLAVTLISGAALAEGDAAAGKKLFKKCAACHSIEPGKKKVGPSLHGVVDKAPGTVEGYKYSKALEAYGESGVIWNGETLDAFLTAPRKAVKGTKMGFPGVKSAQQRADIIAYLREIAGE